MDNCMDLSKISEIWTKKPLNFALPTGGPEITEILRNNWLLQMN